MTHPFQDLDGARKHIFSADGEKYFLRVYTSAPEFAQNRAAVELMSELIMSGAQQELQKELDRRGKGGEVLESRDEAVLLEEGYNPRFRNRAFTIPESRAKARIDGMPNYLLGNAENGGTVFVVENEEGKPACAIYITINGQEIRKELKVQQDKSLIYVSDIFTAPEFRGKNIFSSAFDKIMTMLSNPKRAEQIPGSLQYSVSVTAATELDREGREFNHVMNLPRYYKMWEDRFTNLSIMNRWQEAKITGGRLMAVEGSVPVENIFGPKKSYDEKIMSDYIEAQKKPAAAQNKRPRGAFLSGEMNEDYEVIKEKRVGLMEARSKKSDVARDKSKSAEEKTWLRKPTASAVLSSTQGREK